MNGWFWGAWVHAPQRKVLLGRGLLLERPALASDTCRCQEGGQRPNSIQLLHLTVLLLIPPTSLEETANSWTNSMHICAYQ